MSERLDRATRQRLHGSEYVEQYESHPPSRLVRLLDMMDLRPSMDVLDAGCGNAMLLEHIHGRVGSYTGVDFSPHFIERARERNRTRALENASFHCAAIQDFCRDHPERFDVVFALDLSEHVYDNEWQEIVSAVRTSLRRGGTVYLHTPNADFLIERMKQANFILRQLPEHIAVRGPQENAEFFRRADYSEITVKLIPHYNLLKTLHAISWLPVVGRFMKARIFLSARKQS